MKSSIKNSVCVLFLFAISQLVFGQSSTPAFIMSPEVIQNPGLYYKYSKDSRHFTGIPSLAIAHGGRMWATWYAGPTPSEDANNYVVLSTSNDNGNTWEEVLVVDPDGAGIVRSYDPEVWLDPSGKLWVFWAQANTEKSKISEGGYIAGVWAITCENPDAKNPKWTEPKRIWDGIMMCKPTVLSTGEWLLPVSTWRHTDESAKVVVSTDQGMTWTLRGACNIPVADRAFDEHMIIERKDKSLWMLVRTRFGIGQSTSHDGGATWSGFSESEIEHPSARFFIRKLDSGNLLLVKHGPIHVKTGRSHLMAFISKDDGKSWSKGLLLDARQTVSYPDGQQTSDGIIHLIYDYNRTGDQQILVTQFTEADILSPQHDEMILKVFNHRKVVSDGGRNE